MKPRTLETFDDFKCVHCRRLVHADSAHSGVNNRNHCPYCLFSRHLDADTAGDRGSECLGAMEPIGLTVKKIKKKYGDNRQGELMLIHRCQACGGISINRIAADDMAHLIVDLFRASLQLDEETRQRLQDQTIDLLGAVDAELVYTRLFGNLDLPDLDAWLRGEIEARFDDPSDLI